MIEILEDVIQLVNESTFAYCHYITPNDVGATGGHQCGFTFAKKCYKAFFDEPGQKGSNKDRQIEIKWQKDFCTASRAIYYGVGTRDEYRITRYGRDFEFLKEDYIGSLQIITVAPSGEINGYVLSNQDNIESFIASFNLDINLGNQIIKDRSSLEPEQILNEEFRLFIENHDDFPDTKVMSEFARECVIRAHQYSSRQIANNADSIILKWVEAEYRLFVGLEEKIYRPIYSQPFANCQALVDFSNSILNRRKSRAGKSLEHHLSRIFTEAQIRFEEQAFTENNKMPDFLFPDGASYHNILFPGDKLTMLGAKTTCKDRWRQVLNEADRIPNKHLFTLQRGVSKNQLEEMKAEHLTLVVPRENKTLFLPEYREGIMCLSDFMAMVKERQGS